MLPPRRAAMKPAQLTKVQTCSTEVGSHRRPKEVEVIARKTPQDQQDEGNHQKQWNSSRTGNAANVTQQPLMFGRSLMELCDCAIPAGWYRQLTSLSMVDVVTYILQEFLASTVHNIRCARLTCTGHNNCSDKCKTYAANQLVLNKQRTNNHADWCFSGGMNVSVMMSSLLTLQLQEWLHLCQGVG